MKKFYYFAFIIFLFQFAACSGSRKGFHEMKRISQLIKRLEKRVPIEKIMADLQEVQMANAIARNRTYRFSANQNPERWDNIIGEMETPSTYVRNHQQKCYAVKCSKPIQLLQSTTVGEGPATTDYYNHGMLYADKTNRQDLKAPIILQ